MVEFDIPDIKKDLPKSMTMAAFSGIAWYTAVELNIRLFYLFKRRKGIYFWSCVLSSWGILLHPLAIILADFQVIFQYANSRDKHQLKSTRSFWTPEYRYRSSTCHGGS